MESRPNFYLLLDLPYDPPEENEMAIKKALEMKRVAWGKKRNHPRDAEKVNYYLKLTNQILDVMLDEERRQEEALEAKEIAEKESLKKEKATNKRLDGAINVLSAKGYITNAELTFIEKGTKVSKEVIKKRVTVPIKDEKGSTQSSSTDQPGALNPEKMKQLLYLLDQLDIEASVGSVPTLYDLLELPSSAATKDLSKLSNDLYHRFQNKGVSSAAAEYKKQIYSIANGIFKNEDERKKYDQSVQDKRFETVTDYISIASVHGRIEYTVYKELVKAAVNEGLGKEEAKEKIKRYCQQKNILLLTSNLSNEEELDLHQCQACGIVNVKSASHCRGCGHSLTANCRSCHSSIINGSLHCTNCGQSVMGLQNHDRLLKEGYYALSQQNMAAAEECFMKAEYNFKSQEVVTALQKIATHKKNVDRLIQKVESEIKRKHYYQAQKEWMTLKKIDRHLVEHTRLEREINNNLNLTEKFLIQAASARNSEEAVHFYLEALECCGDCQRAREKLNQFPPEPPTKFVCQLVSETVDLSWAPSRSDGNLVYQIIRKEGSAPIHTQDGVIVGETSNCYYSDQDAEAGKQYFYAILTKRSTTMAKTMVHYGPVMKMLEVENLQAKPENGAVKLTWKAPNKTKIEVWKKEGSIPTKRGDGVKLNGVKVNEVTDQEVSSEKQYGYLVICQYEDATGKFILSNGKSVLTMAMQIEPIVNMAVKYMNNKALIKNHQSIDGEQIVYVSQQPFSGYKMGEFYLYHQLDGEMKDTHQVHLHVDDCAEIDLHGKKPTYLLPVTKLGNATMIGQQKILKYIEDVSQISGLTDDKGDLYLKWNWPKDVEHVLVVYSETNYPTDPRDADSVQRSCSRVSYEAFNGYKIESIKNYQHVFITIYVGEEMGGQTIYSEGARYFYTNSKPIEIYYRLESKGFLLKKKNVISIKSSDSSVKSPELLLVKQKGRQPLSKDDGTEVFVIAEGTDITKYEIDVSDHNERNTYFKLFYANQNEHTRFLLESIGELTTGK